MNLTFKDLGLTAPILETLAAQGYSEPTPIQTQAIPPVLEGKDVVGLAQTGTGKTAAFTLPILQRLSSAKRGGQDRPIRVLILSPTRELAAQIEKSVRDYGQKLSLRSTCVVGGVSVKSQKKSLGFGVDILVATPGRLEDLVSQNAVRLNQIETVVLDEADQMLDIGFMPAIRRILKLTPNKRQTLLFSATMSKEIRSLSNDHLKDPVEVAATPSATTVDRIDQTVVYMGTGDKVFAVNKLIRKHEGKRVIVFTRTKRGADKVVKKLNADGINSNAIHGNKSQGQRERALADFKSGKSLVLVATDIAARGIDVPGIEVVVNYDLPNVPESYVHRIGRTARAGASGFAVSFCTDEEIKQLRAIQKLIKMPIPATDAAGEPMPELAKAAGGQPERKKPQGRPGGPGKRRWHKPGGRPGARSTGSRRAAKTG